MNMTFLPASRRAYVVGLVLLLAAVLATHLQPVPERYPDAAAIDLEAMIPSRFGTWQDDPSGQLAPVPAALLSKVEAAYSRTLARTYVDVQGRRIMLSVAYGSNQLSDRVQAHRPEYCYRAQGFQVGKPSDIALQTMAGALPLRRLVAAQPGRSEPISYWMTIGDQALLPGWGRKLAQLRYGLRGEIPDGLLVRVSSLSNDPAAAYHLQSQFLEALLANVDDTTRARLLGSRKPILIGRSAG